MDIIDTYVGARIQELREKNNFSQEELGRKIGLSRVSISNMEAGRQSISLKKLFLISLALNEPLQIILPTKEWFEENKNKKVKKRIIIEVYE